MYTVMFKERGYGYVHVFERYSSMVKFIAWMNQIFQCLKYLDESGVKNAEKLQ